MKGPGAGGQGPGTGRLNRRFWFGPSYYYRSVDSTMHAAAALPVGSVVVAEEQTAGPGPPRPLLALRAGRRHLLLHRARRPLAAAHPGAGPGRADAIAEATGIACDLRWPNDLMLGGRKVAGILVQLVDGNAIAGIGINVNHTAFRPDARGHFAAPRLPAVRSLASRHPRRSASMPSPPITAAAHRRPSCACSPTLPAMPPAAASRWTSPRASSTAPPPASNPAGFLIVRKDDGTDTLILAGGVRAAGS